jgi:hypothetical protein
MTRSGLLVGAALALTITVASPSAAEDISSANSRMPGCRDFVNRGNQTSLNDAFDQGFCAGTVGGIAFTKRSPCLDIPDGVTLGQEVRVVISYIEARPARMHELFRGLALEALQAAWPCR